MVLVCGIGAQIVDEVDGVDHGFVADTDELAHSPLAPLGRHEQLGAEVARLGDHAGARPGQAAAG